MATINTLVSRGALIPLGGGLARNERREREMYVFPHVRDWLRDVLPNLEPTLSHMRAHELHGGVQTPIEQLDDFLHDFISGANLDFWEATHCMAPDILGIWELKTIDVRLFGWVYQRCVFIVGNSDSAYNCKNNNLYDGYRNDTAWRRDQLDLDAPKHLAGGYSYVF